MVAKRKIMDPLANTTIEFRKRKGKNIASQPQIENSPTMEVQTPVSNIKTKRNITVAEDSENMSQESVELEEDVNIKTTSNSKVVGNRKTNSPLNKKQKRLLVETLQKNSNVDHMHEEEHKGNRNKLDEIPFKLVPRMRKFSGKSDESVESFLRSFEEHAQQGNWSEYVQRIMLSMCLEGVALRWYDELTQDV